MSKNRKTRREEEKASSEKGSTSKGFLPVTRPLTPSQRILSPEGLGTGDVFKGRKTALVISQDNGATSVTVDTSKLVPPKKSYIADSFTIETFIGHSDLYFGMKSPRGREGDLLNCLVVRFSNRVLKSLVVDSHKDFYKGLLKQISVTEKHKKQFGIVLKNQFPVSQDSQHFVYSNFMYAAHGIDAGELMFYKISPAYIHHIASGKPAVFAPDSEGIEPLITITVPIDLLAYFYKKIIGIKNELL